MTNINKAGSIQLGRGVTANEAFTKTAEAFLATLKAKQQSQETVKKRRDCLRKFLLYLEAKGIERFADVDVFDIEINTRDTAKLIETVALLEPTFGGINLEDLKAPECFLIERRLKKCSPSRYSTTISTARP